MEIDNLYSTYDAKAEIDALIPDIESALEDFDETRRAGSNLRMIDVALIERLENLKSTQIDVGPLEFVLAEKLGSSFSETRKTGILCSLLNLSRISHPPRLDEQFRFLQCVDKRCSKLCPQFADVLHCPWIEGEDDIAFRFEHVFLEMKNGALSLAPFAEGADTGGPVRWGRAYDLRDLGRELLAA